MSKVIPLFPLNLVAFPGEKLNLHIFEPRYKQLVKDCVSKDILFGVVPVKNKQLHNMGTTVEIIEIVNTYADGKLDIRTKGISAFELADYKTEFPGKLYPGGEVVELEDIHDNDLSLLTKVLDLVNELYTLMSMKLDLPEANYDFKIYDLAHKVGLSIDQEMELLGIRSEIDRLKYVENHLNNLIPLVKQMETLKEKVRMNGHFKNALPPDLEI